MATEDVQTMELKKIHIYQEIKRRQKLINDQVWELSRAHHAVGLLKLQYEKLDRRIFEATVGITKVSDKRSNASVKKTPNNLNNIDKMSQEEVLRTLEMLKSRLKQKTTNG